MPKHSFLAAATGLPTLPRRDFLKGLSGLARLPLIGGGVAILGAPTASAEPVTRELVDAYDQWLYYERKLLTIEKYGKEHCAAYGTGIPSTRAFDFHFPLWPAKWEEQPQPSARAALVMAAVGCNWRRDNG